MVFDEIAYERPDIDEFERRVSHLLEKFEVSATFDEQVDIIDEINKLRNEVLTKVTIVLIRNSIDTTDEVYIEEQKYSNEKWPIYEMVVSKYYDVLTKSKYKDEIVNKYGNQLMDIAELAVNIANSDVIEDLVVENNLVSEYTKLMATSKIEFKGEVRNLSQLDAFTTSPDRNIRKKASEKFYELMGKNKDDIDSIFDSLIKIRTIIANKLGYESFVELGYARLTRIGYDQGAITQFRNMILKFIVPLSVELREKQRKRLELDVLTYYDEEVRFKTGNASPKGDADWIINKFKKVFEELSEESKEAFHFMNEKNLMNLTTKIDKRRGAFASYLCDYKYPFIFANFNGTRNDVKVLGHEFGHTLQFYIFNKNNVIPEYIVPTKEASEINSITMEYLIWPWMKEFFGEDLEKYKLAHFEDAILTIPYRASIDEFQHYVYLTPNATIKERKDMWIEIDSKYRPYKEYDNNTYLEEGNFWHIQSHLFKFPFYYIDYALAQMCALQIWGIAQSNRDDAWKVYLKHCSSGGSKSFLDLLNHSGISSPFEETAFTDVLDAIRTWFDDCDHL